MLMDGRHTITSFEVDNEGNVEINQTKKSIMLGPREGSFTTPFEAECWSHWSVTM